MWRDLGVRTRSDRRSDAATALTVVDDAPARPTSHTATAPASDRATQTPLYRMSGTNMMCAFGVPGNMIHGVVGCGVAERPVDSAVANGM